MKDTMKDTIEINDVTVEHKAESYTAILTRAQLEDGLRRMNEPEPFEFTPGKTFRLDGETLTVLQDQMMLRAVFNADCVFCVDQRWFLRRPQRALPPPTLRALLRLRARAHRRLLVDLP